jgi:hypothetical protein
MKKRILLITLIGMSIGMNAQNTFPSNGSVGIGTSTPSIWFNSHVVEIQNNRPVLKLNSTGTTGTLVFTNALVSSNHYGEFHLNHSYSSSDPSKSRFRFGSYPGGGILTLQADGNVGIGVTSPKSKLDIGTNYSDPSVYPNKITLWSAEENNYFGFGISEGDLDYFSQHNHRFHTGYNGTPGSEKMVIKSNGNVGIGITNPGSKLSVNGKIHTKEVKVDLIGWSDFVFQTNYNLPTLLEVENHIKEKGHLKDIPSAKEVANSGILLGEMNAKLLQKIEELTLYTIQQEKEIVDLNKLKYKVKTLEKENESLKSLATKILELQKRMEMLEKE